MPGKAVKAVTPGKKGGQLVDPLDLQQQLMRFADDFTARVFIGIDNLRRGTNLLDRMETQRLKLNYLNDTLAVATGPNAIANLLDMVVLVTLTRTTVEEHWIPNAYGESARPLLADCQRAETEIWRETGTVLNPGQQAELRNSLTAWIKEHPNLEEVMFTRALGLVGELGKSSQQTHSSSGSVFNLLMLDPLSGLDPATREIAQTRLLAERALYLGQRMPLVLRGETELLSMNFVSMPEMRQLLTNTAQITSLAERVTQVAEKLPSQLSTERKEILDALEAQEGKLTSLVTETRQALNAADQMATSLNTTIGTFDGLMKRFGVGETKPEKLQDTNSPPFNILDYAKTANELAAAAQQLDGLVRSFNLTLDSPAWNQRLTQVKGLSADARVNANSVLNHAFLLGAALIVLIFACAYLYKMLAARFSSANRPNETKGTT
jgi:hypothetical protein